VKTKYLKYHAVLSMGWLVGCSTAASPTATGGGSPQTSTAPSSVPTKIVVAIDWIISGQHAPFYVAVDKGFYAEQNLFPTIVRGYGSSDTVRRIAAKQADFGMADTSALIAAKAEAAIPVKAISSVMQNSAVSIFFEKDKGIKSPKDLEGKTCGDGPSSIIHLLFPAYAAATNIDASKVTWQLVDPAAQNTQFLTGAVVCVGKFTTSAVELIDAAKKIGRTLDRLLFADSLAIYGNSLIANEDTIRDKPDLVRRFLAATRKGFDYALSHPDEAVTLYQRYNKDQTPENVASELALLKELVFAKGVDSANLGKIDLERISSTSKIVTDALKVSAVPAAQLYDAQFNP
jgi:NitT/TauT family transport system substrate-binding protein